MCMGKEVEEKHGLAKYTRFSLTKLISHQELVAIRLRIHVNDIKKVGYQCKNHVYAYSIYTGRNRIMVYFAL